MSTHKKHLTEMLLKSTHSMFFWRNKGMRPGKTFKGDMLAFFLQTSLCSYRKAMLMSP